MILLPQSCERALLERFLRAEAMAMWAVQAAQRQTLSTSVMNFLKRHEQDERRHLRQFEELVGAQSSKRERLPRVPEQWCALAVHLYGYEALGLEFATLLVTIRPDMAEILTDEEAHVGFFERQVRALLSGGEGAPAARGMRPKRGGSVSREPSTGTSEMSHSRAIAMGFVAPFSPR